jgi:hypothetical protein
MEEQNFSNGQFRLWTKWFWVGIIVAVFNVVAGLVYGIALLAGKNRHKKEGIIIIVIAIAWFIFATYLLHPWLVNAGILPHMLIMKN